ncbi:hypothetical protein MMPV_004870 [Pyropia vietnamensis]
MALRCGRLAPSPPGRRRRGLSSRPPDLTPPTMAAPPTSSPTTGTEFWEGLWAADGGLEPGTRFDRKSPSPALVDALERRAVLPGRLGDGDGGVPLRALVPGCGRGYDVVLLGKSGLFTGGVTGLDVAPTGAAAAAAYVAAAGVPAGVGIECADFFKYEGVPGGYDLIYVRLTAGWGGE